MLSNAAHFLENLIIKNEFTISSKRFLGAPDPLEV
jgi:hypothetical protein